MPTAFYLAVGAVLLVLGGGTLIIRRLMKSSREQGRAEQQVEFEQWLRNKAAEDQERADEIAKRAREAAAAAPGSGSLADRLRDSGRGRPTR